jgi:excisionase family DNA binding protein
MNKLFRIFVTGVIIFSLVGSTICFAAQDTNTITTPTVSTVAAGNVYIPKGTMIKCETITPVNSGVNNVGDRVSFKTVQSLVINGVVVIPAGTAGEAIVKSVKRAGAWGKGGGIELEAKNTKTINNVEVPLSLDTKKYGGGQAMVVPWLLIGIFSGFIHGKDQDIPTGTKFTAAIDADVDLGVKPELLADAMKSPINSVQVQSQDFSADPKSYSEIMTIEDMAEYLQIGYLAANRLVTDGKIPSFKVGGSVRVKKSDVDNYALSTK